MSMKDQSADPTAQKILRRHLLTATLDGRKTVERVEIKEVALAAGQQAGLHFHRCPVVGYVIEGTILFQLEGQPASELHPGDAFFEPAGARVAHFDSASDVPARFIAFYLMGSDDQELITML